ncbi:diacylglycerol/lipid kinase family protein [Chryseolinea lacunae]|uniref:Diacylglycerol kinase family lipid kinase n=1 Tax=Chryseolinea lacunae TaxID=2801331 RepID=A0ABS1KQT0_9BACT|nr:diacylglycerol kinase family lipid kinase [Chryseolinea lacunae]
MKVAVVLNGISLEKKNFYNKFLPALEVLCAPQIFETRSINDATALASKATEKHFDIIFAAGGDGTVNQVVNGVLEGREDSKHLPVLGVIPIGTGNDFARGMEIQADEGELTRLLKNFSPAEIDVGKVTFTTEDGKEGQQYFVNVADVGMGPEVVKKVMASDRPFGSGMSYYQAILGTFFTYQPVHVTLTADTWQWQGKLRTLAVANSKYYGHGLCVAPDARPDDGVFEAFVCGKVSVFDFIRYSGSMKQGRKIIHPDVSYRQAKRIEIVSDARCCIEADGEFLGVLPATIEMVERKLKFLI